MLHRDHLAKLPCINMSGRNSCLLSCRAEDVSHPGPGSAIEPEQVAWWSSFPSSAVGLFFDMRGWGQTCSSQSSNLDSAEDGRPARRRRAARCSTLHTCGACRKFHGVAASVDPAGCFDGLQGLAAQTLISVRSNDVECQTLAPRFEVQSDFVSRCKC